ncbi:stage V sporulation protein AA [Gordoniibacillus kamchatkensis]|uniref:Stage V sporulation protein AA n=1 Tax=Gordoniibacillus kamchatkensis TaxID=1590651 RepID=A0ABR5AA69_9BACL|nr:stage V sporulation protein AA [Paenibacillus sp. VKM B-2647]KIL37792.1 stage V sporulation protein AA [Paenibacillus sp. VKM B-2647]
MAGNAVPYLYIRLRRRARMPQGATIRLGDVAQMIAEPDMERKLRELVLHRHRPQDGNKLLLDMMLIVRKVKELFPDVQIEQFGEPHVLIETEERKRKANPVAIALVWLLLFIGSGLAIMNFHADVSMLEVHRRIYELITGRRAEYPLLLQIPYSLGIGIGMVLFFNHLFKKKFNEEPSPLEVEMFMYQESVNQFIITDEYRKIHDRQLRGDAP